MFLLSASLVSWVNLLHYRSQFDYAILLTRTQHTGLRRNNLHRQLIVHPHHLLVVLHIHHFVVLRLHIGNTPETHVRSAQCQGVVVRHLRESSSTDHCDIAHHELAWIAPHQLCYFSFQPVPRQIHGAGQVKGSTIEADSDHVRDAFLSSGHTQRSSMAPSQVILGVPIL